MNINPINFQGNITAPKAKTQTEEQTETNVSSDASKSKTSYKSAEDVLSYMAQTSNFSDVSSSSDVKQSRKIEVSKYVTPEQAKRIAGFVQDFSGAVETGLKSFESELGSLPEYQNMSDAAKMDVAVTSFLKNNMPDVADNPI